MWYASYSTCAKCFQDDAAARPFKTEMNSVAPFSLVAVNPRILWLTRTWRESSGISLKPEWMNRLCSIFSSVSFAPGFSFSHIVRESHLILGSTKETFGTGMTRKMILISPTEWLSLPFRESSCIGRNRLRKRSFTADFQESSPIFSLSESQNARESHLILRSTLFLGRLLAQKAVPISPAESWDLHWEPRVR